jgi:hypothetical protein
MAVTALTSIYEPIASESADFLAIMDEDIEAVLSRGLRLRPLGHEWRPLHVQVVDERTPFGAPESDFPTWGMAGALALRRRAVELIGPLLSPYGDVLPLGGEGAGIAVFDCTTVIDALDQDRSEIVRFRGGGILAVTRYEFRPEKVSGVGAFRLPHDPAGLFLSGTIVDAITKAELTGLDFNLVWQHAAAPMGALDNG